MEIVESNQHSFHEWFESTWTAVDVQYRKLYLPVEYEISTSSQYYVKITYSPVKAIVKWSKLNLKILLIYY